MSIEQLAKAVVEKAAENSFMIATAESCTGGLIAGALTEISGSSSVFDRGFVTYSNQAKAQMLGVPLEHTEDPGAVSGLVASEMATGALAHSKANISVSVTGIAGPTGGSPEKPVGLVFIATKTQNLEPVVQKFLFADQGKTTRDEIRKATVEAALQMLLEQMA